MDKFKAKFSHLIIEKTNLPTLTGIVSNHTINIIGTVNIPIKIASQNFYLKALIADNVNYNGDILVGLKLTDNYGIRL